MPNQIYKPVTSTISTRQENSFFRTLNGSGLSYSLCDRTSSTEKNSNYFMSFNLPVTYSVLASGSTLALNNPEILQINVDKIVIVPIPKEYYNEFIDGRSITFTVPQLSGATMSAKTLVSSTYSTLQKRDNDIFLGNNLAFLFCDEINLPYTGTSNSAGSVHSSNSTWNVAPYTNRPAAVPYSDLDPVDINSDKRPFGSISYAVPVTPTYPTNTNQGYNYDIPVGFICLDKGFMILTHPSIVNNIPWTQGYQQITNVLNISDNRSDIYFSDIAKSVATFTDINVNFKTSAICIGLPNEFYFTNNPSWDLNKNVQEFNNGTNNFDSVFMTEVGLYNVNNELIAVAKLSEPVEKTFTNLLTFNLDIDV